MLLFVFEADDLRNSVLEANVRATLLDNPEGISEEILIDRVSETLPGANVARLVAASVSRLRGTGAVTGPASRVMLAPGDVEILTAARTNFNQLLKNDIEAVKAVSGLNQPLSIKLITMARNLVFSGKDFEGRSDAQEQFRNFMAQNRLVDKKRDIYECLAQALTIKQYQFGTTVDQIFSTNTFDIYRALGGKTDLTLLLDSNVALPLILALEFPHEESRYGEAVIALNEVSRAHQIKMMTPTVYVNEMAGHGRKALELLEIYPELPEEAKFALRNSRNAFLSHFSYVKDNVELDLVQFLSHFGISAGASVRKIENRILSILESHGIETGMSEWYDGRIRDEIESQKPSQIRVLVNHDAAVVTNLINESKKGYIVATWDIVMIDVVQDLARVYVDNPARVNDFLSVIEGGGGVAHKSEDLLFTLLHMDEGPAIRLAEKIEQIDTVDGAYKLKVLVDAARKRKGAQRLSEEELTSLIPE